MKILQFPDGTLYKVSEEITEFNSKLKAVAVKMVSIMHSEKAIGLAAIQIGIPIRMFVMTTNNKDYILVNPVIKHVSGTQYSEEGCLSEVGRYVIKERALNVTIEYVDTYGSKKKKGFSGLAARCCLHELDHLNGKRPLDEAIVVQYS